MDVCSICGLPKEICACQAIEKETASNISVYTRKERFNKFVTVIQGLKGEELERAAKELKRKLAGGGTYKNGVIVLQGDHREKTREYLMKMGYPKEIIKVS